MVFVYCCEFWGGQVYEYLEVFGEYIVGCDVELWFVCYCFFGVVWCWLVVEVVVVDQVDFVVVVEYCVVMLGNVEVFWQYVVGEDVVVGYVGDGLCVVQCGGVMCVGWLFVQVQIEWVEVLLYVVQCNYQCIVVFVYVVCVLGEQFFV